MRAPTICVAGADIDSRDRLGHIAISTPDVFDSAESAASSSSLPSQRISVPKMSLSRTIHARLSYHVDLYGPLLKG